MQIVLYIMAKTSYRKSLRETVIHDLETWDYGLDVKIEKKVGRKHGWAKIKAPRLYGSINVHWEPHSKTLIGHAVSKRGNYQDELIGRFVRYLIRARSRNISGIAIRTI